METRKRKGKTVLTQDEVVIREFERGRLRSSSGETVTNPKQAYAISQSEERAAKERGTEIRTWRGRTRQRPKRKE